MTGANLLYKRFFGRDENTDAPELPELVGYYRTTESILSDDGLSLSGTLYEVPAGRGEIVILLCSGEDGAARITTEYLKMGYSVLVQDMRATGRSDGKFSTMGLLESRDLMKWVYRICSFKPEARIILHGVHYGAAAVCLLAAGALPENVRALICEESYCSADEQLEYLVNRDGLKPEKIRLRSLKKQFAGVCSVQPDTVSPEAACGHIKRPVLFIAREGDTVIPSECTERLHNACANSKLVIVPEGAADAEGAEKYFEAILSYLDG